MDAAGREQLSYERCSGPWQLIPRCGIGAEPGAFASLGACRVRRSSELAGGTEVRRGGGRGSPSRGVDWPRAASPGRRAPDGQAAARHRRLAVLSFSALAFGCPRSGDSSSVPAFRRDFMTVNDRFAVH